MTSHLMQTLPVQTLGSQESMLTVSWVVKCRVTMVQSLVSTERELETRLATYLPVWCMRVVGASRTWRAQWPLHVTTLVCPSPKDHRLHIDSARGLLEHRHVPRAPMRNLHRPLRIGSISHAAPACRQTAPGAQADWLAAFARRGPPGLRRRRGSHRPGDHRRRDSGSC